MTVRRHPKHEYRVTWRRSRWQPGRVSRRVYQSRVLAHRFAARLVERGGFELIEIEHRQVGPWCGDLETVEPTDPATEPDDEPAPWATNTTTTTPPPRPPAVFAW